ncbi:MAG: galactokinase [Terriglobales bacterium]
MDAHALTRRFHDLFNKTPRLYRAPGRVNLIGEHTDYNDGFVMPAAIDLYCCIAIAPRADRQLVLHSTQFSQSTSVDLGNPGLQRTGQWTDYIVGTAIALGRSGCAIGGADIMVHGEIPFGSGLSSSAAIEVAAGFALLDLAGQSIDRTKLAISCQRAENDFVGARCGIMDQFISANGHAGHALLLDCRSLQSEPLPIPQAVRLVVCNTGVKHSIAGGEYGERRAQCEEAVRRLSSAVPGIRALRDVTPDQLETHKGLLPDVIYRRCRHVVTEDERVQQAAAALTSGDLHAFGRLMAESHRSLRDDYEVSCRELDLMVELAMAQPGIVGARMTGGGFGGCTANLVRAESADRFATAVGKEYEKQTGIHPEVYVFSAADGVHRMAAAS